MDLPQPFGAYVLDRSLAKGGMAEVFLAHTGQAGFKKQLCIKRAVAPAASAREYADMFRDEAALAAKLQHPNIVSAFDFGEVDGVLYLAMEYVEGLTLASLLSKHVAQQAPLEVASALQIALCLCRALEHAHTLTDENGRHLAVVHRDVSPQNVLLSLAGEVKLGDFGVARAVDRMVQTRTGITKGKASYMAPEQAQADPVDHRSDQFATGIVLWEMLTCRRLFRARNDMEAMQKVVRAEVAPPSSVRPGLPPELDALTLRALSREPAQRFSSMAALEEALLEVVADLVKSPLELDLRPVVRRALDEDFTRPSAPSPGTSPEGRAFDGDADTLARARSHDATEPAGDVIEEAAIEATQPMAPSAGAMVELVSPKPPAAAPRQAPVASRRVAWLLIATAATTLLVGAAAGAWLAARGAKEAPSSEVSVALARSASVEPVVSQRPAPPPAPEAEPETPAVVEDAPESEPLASEGEGEDAPPSTSRRARPSPRRASAPRASPAPEESETIDDASRVDELERRGTQALLAGNAGLAAQYLKEATSIDPRRASLFRGLGQANEKLNRRREAVAAYRVYLALSPSAPDKNAVMDKLKELSR